MEIEGIPSLGIGFVFQKSIPEQMEAFSSNVILFRRASMSLDLGGIATTAFRRLILRATDP